MFTKDENKNLDYVNGGFEIKAFELAVDDDPDLFIGSFKGLASTFGNIDFSWLKDIIKPGAFTPALQKIEESGKMPKSLIQHDSDRSGAIFTSINQTKKGLVIEGKFIGTTEGKNLRKEVLAGSMSDFSISFIIGEHFTNEEGNRVIKTILELPEISFVRFPANPKAVITGVKSMPDNERDFEKALTDMGYSIKQAKTIISRGFKGCTLRDEESGPQRDAGLDLLSAKLDLLNEKLKG